LTNILILIIELIVILGVGFSIFMKWFLRDPERDIPTGNVIVAPADGKVLEILDLDKIDKINIKKGLVGKIQTLCSDVGTSCYIVSIFMSPFVVHIQRSALEGKVLNVKHVPGNFDYSGSFINGILNEKTETLIENKKIGKFKIIQIAGIIVNRIENWAVVGKKINIGQRLGLIRLGSQVSLILPKDKVELMVKIGDRVYAGSSVIGRLK